MTKNIVDGPISKKALARRAGRAQGGELGWLVVEAEVLNNDKSKFREGILGGRTVEKSFAGFQKY